MKPVNPNATKEAVSLLEYLYSIAGKKIITGQHTQTVLMEEREYIRKHTGKLPKLMGFELLGYSPNINYGDAGEECLREVQENRHTVENAINWAVATDGIVYLCFHWFSPIGGHDKSFYSENTDFDPSKIFEDGTAERKAFYRDMDVIAKLLGDFKHRGIPVLWRPFHEADGTWFWWGSKGVETARELYKLMFDYYVNVKHLDNLLWVWNAVSEKGYPGDEYVDVVSRDIYAEPHTVTDYAARYEELIRNTSDKKVAALGEVGVIPDIELLERNHTPWAFYMTWSKEFCIGEKYNSTEALRRMYDSPYSVKLEKTGCPVNVTPETFDNLHSVVCGDNMYRDYETTVEITGIKAPSPVDLPHLMRHFADQIMSSRFSLNPVELAAMAHKRMIDIQPYSEGCFETAMALMNYIFACSNMPNIVIDPDDPLYHAALSSSTRTRDMEPFTKFVEGIIDKNKNLC